MKENKRPDEFSTPMKEYDLPEEYPSTIGTDIEDGEEEADRDRKNSRRKQAKKCCMLFSSVAAGVVVIYSSFNIDILKNDIFADSHREEAIETVETDTVRNIVEETSTEVTEKPASSDGVDYIGECADDEFPVLPNMAVDSSMNEDFIIVVDEDNPDGIYIHLNDRLIGDRGMVDNITYDENTNTLTLDNANADVIVANLMGNGFKMELIGESHIGMLLVYGFYYGGSVTFTGDGTIYVNENYENDIGIVLEAEYSKSCIMVDKEVTINAYGISAAIMVFDTKADKGLYYLKPQKLDRGMRLAEHRRMYGVSGEESHGERDDWTIVDIDDNSSIITKLVISPQ